MWKYIFRSWQGKPHSCGFLSCPISPKYYVAWWYTSMSQLLCTSMFKHIREKGKTRIKHRGHHWRHQQKAGWGKPGSGHSWKLKLLTSMFHIVKKSQRDLRVRTAEEGKHSEVLQVSCVQNFSLVCTCNSPMAPIWPLSFSVWLLKPVPAQPSKSSKMKNPLAARCTHTLQGLSYRLN